MTYTTNAYYLDESRHAVQKCMEYTQMCCEKEHPELLNNWPTYSTFRRKALDIEKPLVVLGRYGPKAYYDQCSRYIRRSYDIAPNEWWVADTHTFDIMSVSNDGAIHRIYTNSLYDARSGIFVGWYITANPSSDATLLCLKRAIQQYGIPKNLLTDNGREYLTYDIGGRGHRSKKVLADGSIPFAPPGVFERLGITMGNAIPRNARAKLIERRFRDAASVISKSISAVFSYPIRVEISLKSRSV